MCGMTFLPKNSAVLKTIVFSSPIEPH
jgi:hypothetical protein